MSDLTPKDGFDGLDTDGGSFGFPGVDGQDSLTEEERSFTFDEDYLGKAPPPTEADKPDAEGQARINALAAAFQRLSRRQNGTAQTHSEKSETVAEDLPKPSRRRAAEPEKAEKRKLPAARRRKRGALSGRRREDGYLVRPDPVTTGCELRSDEMLVYDSELDEIDYTDEEDLPELRDYLPIRFGRYGRVGIAGGILYALFVISASIVLACICWMFAADVLALGKEPLTAVVFIGEYVPEGDDPVYSIVNDEEREIQVDINQVADELKRNGIIEYKWLFRLYSQISHAETKIDPGTYSLSTALDYRAIVTSLQFGSGNQEITKVTFPEGFTTEQIFTLLVENHICKMKDLREAAANYEFDYDFLADLELGDPKRLDGYLFPDTYEFYQGEDATVALNRFLRNFNSKFDADMSARAESLGRSVHDILTIASLIEKESANAEESPTIASVIYNRLNAGWKLGLDSTINYILGTSTFDLTYADLEIDDPYNTYLYEGLPPGPICNPGLSSIEAALYPDSTDYWYWYAVDGESHFFTNVDDRNAFMNANSY